MSSAQEKTVDLPSPHALSIAMVPGTAGEQAQRFDSARAEVAAVLKDLYVALARLMRVKMILKAPPERDEFYFDDVEELSRFEPGVDKMEFAYTDVEAEFLGGLEIAAGAPAGSPSGIASAIRCTQRLLEISHFSLRESMEKDIEGLKPEIYRSIAEAAAKGEWLKGADLT